MMELDGGKSLDLGRSKQQVEPLVLLMVRRFILLLDLVLLRLLVVKVMLSALLLLAGAVVVDIKQVVVEQVVLEQELDYP
jgi:hypothetical protein